MEYTQSAVTSLTASTSQLSGDQGSSDPSDDVTFASFFFIPALALFTVGASQRRVYAEILIDCYNNPTNKTKTKLKT